jgi:hypothetical protein
MLKGGVVFTSGWNLERPRNRINEGLGDVVMEEKPRLVLPRLAKGEPFDYQCSRCGQPFLLPEDRTPREAMAELWAAFNQHVQEAHPEDDESTEASGEDAWEKT